MRRAESRMDALVFSSATWITTRLITLRSALSIGVPVIAATAMRARECWKSPAVKAFTEAGESCRWYSCRRPQIAQDRYLAQTLESVPQPAAARALRVNNRCWRYVSFYPESASYLLLPLIYLLVNCQNCPARRKLPDNHRHFLPVLLLLYSIKSALKN